ncbi:YdcH family protein [Methylocella sp.]|uniref:YdcH family protein n=1 Tax=Methylocella sp. TaxID=1978226 RepID=UPI0035B1CC7E
MSIENHLSALEQRHDALDREIEKALLHPAIDELKLAELKRRKLQLKDEITKLRQDASALTLH